MHIFKLIEEWAYDRNIIEGSTPQAQMLKLTEEVGELAAAIGKNKQDNLREELGDCVVVLTILAAQNKMTIEECSVIAYNKIKNRKGKIIGGVFVREE